MITTYTTYADVRAALGVSTDDLDDATLGLNLYSDYLQGELEDIALTLPDTFDTLKALPAPTAIETRFLQTCGLFCTFAVANQLSTSLPLFTAKQVGDGKAVVQRFDNPYKETIASISKEYTRMRNRLIAALTAVGTTSADAPARTYMGVVSPSVDPVVGS